MMDEQVRKSYEISLRDLEQRCSEAKRQLATIQTRLKELHQTAQMIHSLLHESDGMQMALLPNPETTKYAALSVRWAILSFLSDAKQPLTAQEIADALITGGIQTEASNFTNNVSSVLSQMRAKTPAEVATADGKWIISDNGRSAWRHIQNKRAARSSHSRFRIFADTPGAPTSGVSH